MCSTHYYQCVLRLVNIYNAEVVFRYKIKEKERDPLIFLLFFLLMKKNDLQREREREREREKEKNNKKKYTTNMKRGDGGGKRQLLFFSLLKLILFVSLECPS